MSVYPSASGLLDLPCCSSFLYVSSEGAPEFSLYVSSFAEAFGRVVAQRLEQLHVVHYQVYKGILQLHHALPLQWLEISHKCLVKCRKAMTETKGVSAADSMRFEGCNCYAAQDGV